MNSAYSMNELAKSIALNLGFDDCGFAALSRLVDTENTFQEWIEKGYHGEMHYMENHYSMRMDPSLLVPNAKSVVVFIKNYFPENDPNEISPYKIAKYALGKDYHKVIKKKLKQWIREMKIHFPQFEGRGFVDSAPIMERQWAEKAGLGWIGKNSLLLKKTVGSYFFIATIICNLEFIANTPVSDHCGTCTACIDACPTQAIVEPYVIDARKCISYLTIEKKSALSETEHEMSKEWLFGCDVCQDVCPWNKFSSPHQEPLFQPHIQFPKNTTEWDQLDEESFEQFFGHTPLKRAGYKKIKERIIHQLNS